VEQPIKVSGELDGKFDTDDAVEFYGVGIDSPYSNSRIYWLLIGKQPGRRIVDVKTVEGKPTTAVSFAQTMQRGDRSIYFAALKNGERENFFGAVLTNTPLPQTMTVLHLAPDLRGDAELEVALQGVTDISHQVRVLVNDVEIGRMNFVGQNHNV